MLREPVAFGASESPYRVVGALLADLLSVAYDGDPQGAEAAVERALDLASLGSRSAQRAARHAMRVAFRLDEDDSADDEATPRELALVLRRLLVARAAMGPVLVLVDGLELADLPSRHALGELARRPPPAAVLLVYAGREGDPFARAESSRPRRRKRPWCFFSTRR